MSQTLAPALAQATDRQSRTVRDLGLACCAWLLVCSGAVLLWLLHLGTRIDLWMMAACAMPPLLTLTLAWRRTTGARQDVLHLVAATLLLPILLLLWAGSVDHGLHEMSDPAPALDPQALFRGAEAVEDTDLRSAGIVLQRSGRFADGSELRLMRFAQPQAARDQLAMLAQAMQAEPFTDGGRQGLRLLGNGVGPQLIVVERHGTDLLELRAADRTRALARLAAQRVAAPVEEAMAASADPVASWPFFTGMAIAHAGMFVALVAWAGSHVSRVPALNEALIATPDALRARLLSLARPFGPFHITELEMNGSTTLRVDASPSPRRLHHIILHIDASRGGVLVHERLAINGDAPQHADEASLRGPGDDPIDAARPDARRLWSSTRQATMIAPSRLAAVPLRLQARHADLPPGYAASLDGEGVLTTLCALVTRSGWHWQPRLFGRHL